MKTDLKYCFITLIFSFIGLSSFAQTDERRGFIGYSVGPSYHVGNLGYISSDNEKEQFTKTGYCVNYANFGYLFKKKKNLGINASFVYGETFVDNTNENDWWVIMGITAGPMFSLSIQDKLHLDLKLKIGRLGTINYINSLANTNDFGHGFALDIRTSARYDIFKRWCLFLETGYFTTNQKFPDSREVKIQELIIGFGIAYRFKFREKVPKKQSEMKG